MTTRRGFLAGGAATAVAVAIQPVAFVAQAAVASTAAPQMLAWAFDIKHGDYRDTCIAPTAQDAHAEMINKWFDVDLADDCPHRVYGNTDECTVEGCGCEDSGMSTVEREPKLDTAAARGEITIDDYAKAGWGYVCDRCGGEQMGGDWQPINGVAVCDECITRDEWREINPEYAAELDEDDRINAMTDDEFAAYEAVSTPKSEYPILAPNDRRRPKP